MRLALMYKHGGLYFDAGERRTNRGEADTTRPGLLPLCISTRGLCISDDGKRRTNRGEADTARPGGRLARTPNGGRRAAPPTNGQAANLPTDPTQHRLHPAQAGVYRPEAPED